MLLAAADGCRVPPGGCGLLRGAAAPALGAPLEAFRSAEPPAGVAPAARRCLAPWRSGSKARRRAAGWQLEPKNTGGSRGPRGAPSPVLGGVVLVLVLGGHPQARAVVGLAGPPPLVLHLQKGGRQRRQQGPRAGGASGRRQPAECPAQPAQAAQRLCVPELHHGLPAALAIAASLQQAAAVRCSHSPPLPPLPPPVELSAWLLAASMRPAGRSAATISPCWLLYSA